MKCASISGVWWTSFLTHYAEISNRVTHLKTPKTEAKMSGSLAYLREIWTNEGHQNGWNESICQHIQLLSEKLQTTTQEALKLLNITEEEYEAARKAVEAKNNPSKPDATTSQS